MTGTHEPPPSLRCTQTLEIEGPGAVSYADGDKWTGSTVSNVCLLLEDDYPLKVFTTQKLSSDKIPVDGIIRNLSFTNAATNTTVNNYCSTIVEEENTAVLVLDSSWKPFVVDFSGKWDISKTRPKT